jgi:hypothetical protein
MIGPGVTRGVGSVIEIVKRTQPHLAVLSSAANLAVDFLIHRLAYSWSIGGLKTIPSALAQDDFQDAAAPL